MDISNYDMRRPMFWLVTMVALAIVARALLVFVRSGFLHPVRVVGNLLALAAIWIVYFGIVRDLRTAHAEIADSLSIRVETSVGLCCILGYGLSIARNGLTYILVANVAGAAQPNSLPESSPPLHSKFPEG